MIQVQRYSRSHPWVDEPFVLVSYICNVFLSWLIGNYFGIIGDLIYKLSCLGNFISCMKQNSMTSLNEAAFWIAGPVFSFVLSLKEGLTSLRRVCKHCLVFFCRF